MKIDKVSRVVYADPIVVTRVKQVHRELTEEEMLRKFIHKTPVKVQVVMYDQRGRLVGNGETINTYA